MNREDVASKKDDIQKDDMTTVQLQSKLRPDSFLDAGDSVSGFMRSKAAIKVEEELTGFVSGAHTHTYTDKRATYATHTHTSTHMHKRGRDGKTERKVGNKEVDCQDVLEDNKAISSEIRTARRLPSKQTSARNDRQYKFNHTKIGTADGRGLLEELFLLHGFLFLPPSFSPSLRPHSLSSVG